MRVLEKITLILYSIIILFISLIFSLIIFNWLEIQYIFNFFQVIKSSQVTSIIVLVISVLFILLSIKNIFFGTRKKDFYKDNILLGNEEGKLVITKASIENLVNNNIKVFNNIQEYGVKVKFDKLNNIYINIDIQVNENVVIKELTDNIKEKIKQSIKRTSDLETKEINIKIKNIKKTENIIKE